MTYLQSITQERDNLQALLLAQSAAGLKPNYGNGPRNVQWTAELQRAQARVKELTELIASMTPDEISTPVYAL